MKSRFFSVLVLFMALIFLSCGGPPSYTAPVVSGGNVVQSECMTPEGGEKYEENIEVTVVGGDIVIVHSNIFAPENSLLGLKDVDGYLTYERMLNYYYLEAGDQFINVREKFQISSSDKNCLYDMTVRISNVSGGIYHLSIYGHTGELLYSEEVRVR